MKDIEKINLESVGVGSIGTANKLNQCIDRLNYLTNHLLPLVKKTTPKKKLTSNLIKI